MTDDIEIPESISSPEEFEAALAAIVERAVHDGTDVSGAWEFRTSGSTHDWEVNITELAKRGDGGSESGAE